MCTIRVGIDHGGGFAHVGAGSKWKVSESLLNTAVNLKLVFWFVFFLLILGIFWWSGDWGSVLSLHRAWGRSLVWELKSC